MIIVFIIKEKKYNSNFTMEKSGKHLLSQITNVIPVRRHIDTILWEEINATPVYYFFKCIMMSKHQTNLNWEIFVK